MHVNASESMSRRVTLDNSQPSKWTAKLVQLANYPANNTITGSGYLPIIPIASN